jgi:hypothetical protein
MTAPLLPVSPLPAVAPRQLAFAEAMAATAAATALAAAEVKAPAAGAAVAACSEVQWSAQTVHKLKLQAFEQLIAQLALQIQGSEGAKPASWPTQGLPAALQRWLQSLLAQVQVTVQAQARPLQLVAAQPGSAALIQALVQASAQSSNQAQHLGSALKTAAALSATAAAALAQAGQGPELPDSRPGLPVLQNWWVQQGVVQTEQGERNFALTLQVPAAWAQAVGGAGIALGAALLRLSAQELAALPANGPLALVVQPQTGGADGGGLRTSALLWLELQPVAASPVLPSTSGGAAALALNMPAPLLAQEVQQLLHNKSDPWLLMAAAQAANALPQPRRHAEHRSHLCSTEGCVYQGLAPCAQPFCSEMNRIWSTARSNRLA